MSAGLLDQLELHIVPVLLGDGMRLLDAALQGPIELVPTRVVDTPDVTHIRWVGGEGLADPSTAKSVRVRDGLPAVTDGPFAEAKEQIVGYSIVDCGSQDRAVEIATRWPDARLWGMEVRPILSPDGLEM